MHVVFGFKSCSIYCQIFETPKLTNIPKATGPSKATKNVAAAYKPPQKLAETNKCSNCPRSFSTEFALKVHMCNFHNIGGEQTKKATPNGSFRSGAVKLQCKFCAKTFAFESPWTITSGRNATESHRMNGNACLAIRPLRPMERRRNRNQMLLVTTN